MKGRPVAEMTSDELVERFVEISVEQGKASAFFETARFNRLYGKLSAVVRELRARPGDERHRLLKLYDHPDLQVRLNAAERAYALDPEAAIATFQAIKDSRQYPWAGDAGMSLSLLEMGMSKLPEDPLP